MELKDLKEPLIILTIAGGLFLAFSDNSPLKKKKESSPTSLSESIDNNSSNQNESHRMFDVMLQKAKNGDSMAQNDVAVYYKEGIGVAQNYSEAIYWYRKSAAQGDPVGMYGLGQCYATGSGVPQNYHTAADYILRAANIGLREAQQTIAYMYENGLGVDKNYYQATYWRNKAQNH